MATRYDPGKVNRLRFDANAAYDLSGFEAERARPVREEEPYRRPELKVADERKPKTRAQLRTEEVRGYKVSAKVVAVAVILFAMLAAVLYGESMKNQLSHEISTLQNQLNVAKSENTRLNMELNALVSIEKIDQYATEKLGMVKMSKYQIEYIDTAAAKSKEQEEASSDGKRIDPGAGATGEKSSEPQQSGQE